MANAFGEMSFTDDEKRFLIKSLANVLIITKKSVKSSKSAKEIGFYVDCEEKTNLLSMKIGVKSTRVHLSQRELERLRSAISYFRNDCGYQVILNKIEQPFINDRSQDGESIFESWVDCRI